MRKNRKAALSIALAALMAFCAAAFAVFAANSTSAGQFADNAEVQGYQQTIQALEQRQKELQQQLKNVQNDRYTAQQKAADLNELILSTEKKIETTQNLLNALSAQISEKEQEIAAKETEIISKQAEVDVTREKFLMLVRAQYESETTGILGVVLGSDSVSDLLSRIEYMANILEYNSTLLEKFKREKQELEDMKAVLESSKSELDAAYASQMAYSDTLAAEEAALQLQKGDADAYVASLKKTEAEITEQYNAARAEEEKESQRLEALLRQLAKENESDYVGGKFIWPVDTSIRRISSGYGWRTYYYYGKKVTDFHMGIDIPAPVGTDIYAVQSGKVIVAQSHSSYGNYIVIDHGGGISTLYAHCSQLLVKVGDEVVQGDHIAEMGSTGNSTGSHVHFEVRVDGKHEDPIANGWVVQP